MSTLIELLHQTATAEEEFAAHSVLSNDAVTCSTPSLRDEQIHSLVQQLFFGVKPIRSVGFAPIDSPAPIASLCLDVAQALTEEGRYDVGLIDASCHSIPLHEQLRITAPAKEVTCWPIAPRLWLVPRQSWRTEKPGQPTNNRNLERLHELATEFDFSILHCAPMSCLTTRIGQNCDGLVLVLTANKTRRLVAAQTKDQLIRAHVPLLGTVLAERQLPVPEGLYRNL